MAALHIESNLLRYREQGVRLESLSLTDAGTTDVGPVIPRRTRWSFNMRNLPMFESIDTTLERISELVFLSDQNLAARYEVHRATIWRWADVGRFPKPVHLSPGCTRWRLADVRAWEAKQGGE